MIDYDEMIFLTSAQVYRRVGFDNLYLIGKKWDQNVIFPNLLSFICLDMLFYCNKLITIAEGCIMYLNNKWGYVIVVLNLVALFD